MTQALFDLSYLDRFEELIGGWPVPLLLGIFYVRSYQLAVRLHNEVPGEGRRERGRRGARAGEGALRAGPGEGRRGLRDPAVQAA
jgi:5,10-methylenetetrahydrofolate reductase